MSYDLSFKSRQANTRLTKAQLHAFFEERRFYEISASQISYHNQDTGVYFSFYFDVAADVDPAGLLPLTFNLNFLRPHTFALEAAIELEALVGHFDLLVVDPQSEELEAQEFERPNFIRTWNHGNGFAYHVFFSREEASIPPLFPYAKIEKYWDWNYRRAALQQEYGDSIFVPRIFFMEYNQAPASFVVWADAMPVALPKVDLLLLLRHDLAQPSRQPQEKPDMALLPWGTALPHLTAFTPVSDHYLADYLEVPTALEEFMRSLPTQEQALNGLSIDKILDLEIAQKYIDSAE